MKELEGGEFDMQEIKKVVKNMSRGSEWWYETRGLSAGQIVAQYAKQPICPRCEGMACRDVGWKDGGRAGCVSCGWRGATITVDEYMTARLYR